MKTKICTTCGEEKRLSEYHKDKSKKDGLQYKCKLCAKQYQQENKERLAEQQKQHYQKNKERILEQQKQYQQENKERINERRKQYLLKRRNTDPLFRLQDNIRRLISISLSKNGYTKKSKTHEILGCSYEDFIQHIESQFEPWMTWENYGEWELDHNIPVSSYEDEDELIKLNHYTNLQPMRAELNRKKSDSYLEEDKQRFLKQLSRTLKIKQ